MGPKHDGTVTVAQTSIPAIVNFDDFNETPPTNRRGDGNPNTTPDTRDWEKVPSGTSSSYRPVAADEGKFLLAIATYADGKSNTEDDSETADVDETEHDRAYLVVGDTDPDTTVTTDTDFRCGLRRPATAPLCSPTPTLSPKAGRTTRESGE